MEKQPRIGMYYITAGALGFLAFAGVLAYAGGERCGYIRPRACPVQAEVQKVRHYEHIFSSTGISREKTSSISSGLEKLF